MSTYEKFKNEIVAGGSVEEKPDDELAGGWRGARLAFPRGGSRCS